MDPQHLLLALCGWTCHQGTAPTFPIRWVWQNHRIHQETPSTLTTESCPDMPGAFDKKKVYCKRVYNMFFLPSYSLQPLLCISFFDQFQGFAG